MAFIKPYREKPSPLAKEIICEKCGEKFYTKKPGQGKTKYCVDCKVIVFYEHEAELRKQNKEKRRLRRQGVMVLNSPTTRP